MRIIFATRVMRDKALLVGQLDPTTGKVTDFEETGQMWFGGGNKNSKAQYLGFTVSRELLYGK